MRNVNPAMFELINAHQQEFIWLLNQPVVQPNMPMNPNANVQQQERPVLTEDDENNITQLMGITGFDRSKCYKGYVVCGKNLDLAAS